MCLIQHKNKLNIFKTNNFLNMFIESNLTLIYNSLKYNKNFTCIHEKTQFFL